MTGFVVSSIAIFLVVAPVGMQLGPDETRGPRAAPATFGLTLVALLAASASSPALLRWLSVSGPDFELAAAIALLPLALRRSISGTSTTSSAASSGASRVSLRLVGGPAALVTAVALSSRFGIVTAMAASAGSTLLAAVALGKVTAWERRHVRIARWVARLFGALLLGLAAGLTHDWLFTV